MRKGLWETAYEYLLSAIMNYSIMPGEAIIEQEVSDKLGISRTPVREALKQLVSEGLVNHIAGKGTFAFELSSNDIEEIFELRGLLEVAAAARAAETLPREKIDFYRERLFALDDQIAKEAYFTIDQELHDDIISCMHNVRIAKILRQMSQQINLMRRFSSMTPSRLAESRVEHLCVVNAIAERDAVKAKKYMSQHLENVKLNTLRVCRESRLLVRSEPISSGAFI